MADENLLLEKIEAYNFFEKQEWIERTTRSLFLFLLGCVFFYLTKVPGAGFRPLVVAIGPVIFRYSLFGNIFIIVALVLLSKNNDFPASVLLLGSIVYFLHGLSSVFDYAALFMTNIFLEVLATIFPVYLIMHFMKHFPRVLYSLAVAIAWFFSIIYMFLILRVYIWGAFFSMLQDYLSWRYAGANIEQYGFMLRFGHGFLGIVFIVLMAFLIRNRRRMVVNFIEMESIVYLDKP